METGVLFYEEQRFNNFFIWLIFIGLHILFGWGIIQQVIMGIPFGDNPAPDFLLISFESFNILLTLFFIFIHQKTIITKDYIEVHFIPFAQQKIEWSKLEKAYIRTYKPLREYGGWGIRHSFNNGKAYNTKGNIGLQLELKNGKKILIGTQKGEELERIVNQVMI